MRDIYILAMEELPIGFAFHKLIYDREGRPCDYEFLSMNKRFEELTGFVAEKTIGLRLSDLPGFETGYMKWVTMYSEVALTGQTKEFEEYAEALGRYYRIKAFCPEYGYFITYLTDLTDEKNQIRTLEELSLNYKLAEMRYSIIAEYAFDWETWENEAGKLMYVSPACFDVTGYSSEAFYRDSSLMDRIIHEEDWSIWQSHRHSPDASKREIRKEIFRIRHRNGNIVWIEHTCSPAYDRDGNYLGYRANNRDITSRLNAENALKESEERYRLLTEFASDVIWVLNLSKSRFTYISPAVYQLRGYTVEEAMAETLEEALTPESRVRVAEVIQTNLQMMHNDAVSKDYYITEIQQPCKDGRLIWVEVSTKLRISDDGDLEVVGVSRNIEERKRQEQQVRYLSYYDQLTEVYNRRFYEEEMKRLDTARNLPLTLIMADVNGLKLVNDAFGHISGDALLKGVARVIKNAAREDDIIARIGGDEFIMLLPKTRESEAAKIVERIKMNLARESNEQVIMSVSFGWATKTMPEENMESVFSTAEDYMYRRKLMESKSMKSQTFHMITQTLYKKDRFEETHSLAVGELCRLLGRELKLTDLEIEDCQLMGQLHDIGIIGVDRLVLAVDDPLDPKASDEFSRHPEIGYHILRSISEVAHLSDYILSHHEKLDGSGYPRGLSGNALPLLSRILALAEKYCDMTGGTPHHRQYNPEDAMAFLKDMRDVQYDGKVIDALEAVLAGGYTPLHP